VKNQIIPNGAPKPSPAPVQSDRAEALDVEWCAERAVEALRYLATFHPECSGSEALHSHQDAAHEAAVAGDREAYLEALRAFMGAGRGEALRIRKEAA
jgi:hypothetical protein